VQVGAGELAPPDFTSLFRGGATTRRISTAAWTAPPSGLFLERVLYAGDPALPKLAAVTQVGLES